MKRQGRRLLRRANGAGKGATHRWAPQADLVAEVSVAAVRAASPFELRQKGFSAGTSSTLGMQVRTRCLHPAQVENGDHAGPIRLTRQ